MGVSIRLSEAVERYRQEVGATENSYDWYRRRAQRFGAIRIADIDIPTRKEHGTWLVDQDDLSSAIASHRRQVRLRKGAAERDSASRRRRRGGWILGVVGGVIIGLLADVLYPPLNHAISDLQGNVFGVDHPIELAPICDGLGGIIAPHAERGAAYKYHCRRLSRPISRHEIEEQCVVQWGPGAQLVLHNPDSASGWACRTPGWLH
jgi:hypothetical protein